MLIAVQQEQSLDAGNGVVGRTFNQTEMETFYDELQAKTYA